MRRLDSVSSFAVVSGCGMQLADVVAEARVVRCGLEVAFLDDRDRRRRRHPVDGRVVDLELVEGVPRAVEVHSHDRSRRAGGRRCRPVCVGGQDPREVRVDREHVLVDHAGRLAGEHRGALEAPEPLATVPTGRRELRRGHHVRVLRRPDGHLRIVVELGGVHLEVVRAPCSRRIIRRGNGDALVERPGARAVRSRELGAVPATGVGVVEDDRVAVVVVSAGRARLEEHVAVDRTDQRRARLVPDPELDVVPLHVVVRADIAVRVGREAPDRRCCRPRSSGSGRACRRGCSCRRRCRASTRARSRRRPAWARTDQIASSARGRTVPSAQTSSSAPVASDTARQCRWPCPWLLPC